MFRLACAAPNCLMRTYDFTKEQSKLVKNNYTVSFHKFPRDSKHRLAWIAAAKKSDWNPSLDDSLCSLHFGDDCFDQASQLYEHALPTIFFEDFRHYIKNLAKEIDLEVDLESSDENEDILSKSLKSIGSLISDDIDDGDQIVECEISISDDDDGEGKRQFTNFETKAPPSNETTATASNKEKPIEEPKKLVTVSPSTATKGTSKSVFASPTTNTTEPKKTSSSKEGLQKLYNMIQTNSLQKNLLVEPSTKEFVHQLLNVVEMANLQNASVPNTYLITTRQENKNAKDQAQKVVPMETDDIIKLIARTVKTIRKGEFRKSDLLTIICASPAIFLIKNVSVKSFPSSMNAVYVVTSEDLIEPLNTLHLKMEKDETQKSAKPVVSVNSTKPAISANSTSSKVNVGNHKVESNTAISKTSSQTQIKGAQGQNTSLLSKVNASVTPVRPIRPKSDFITNFQNNPLKSVKIDLKALKSKDTMVTQSLKNLNLTGVPTLLENVGLPRQNVLKLNIASPLPSALVSGAPKSNVIRLKLSTPMAVPKGAVHITDGSKKDARKDSISNGTEDKQTEPPPPKKSAVDSVVYLKNQKRDIERLERDILHQEREIGLMRKKILILKKRFLAVKNPNETKTDEQVVEDILNKYLDPDAVQFFISQMKVSGKTYTQFRWSEEDKLFALGLLYKHPTEYNILFQKFTLPSDKTLSKFVSKIKKAESKKS